MPFLSHPQDTLLCRQASLTGEGEAFISHPTGVSMNILLTPLSCSSGQLFLTLCSGNMEKSLISPDLLLPFYKKKIYCYHFYFSISLFSCVRVLGELNTRCVSGLEFYSPCAGLMIVMAGMQKDNNNNRKLIITFRADAVKL